MITFQAYPPPTRDTFLRINADQALSPYTECFLTARHHNGTTAISVKGTKPVEHGESKDGARSPNGRTFCLSSLGSSGLHLTTHPSRLFFHCLSLDLQTCSHTRLALEVTETCSTASSQQTAPGSKLPRPNRIVEDTGLLVTILSQQRHTF